MMNELQGKYLNGSLNEEEMHQFLNYLKEHQDAPFREKRMRKLERLIKEKERRDAARTKLEQEQRNAALEYAELTKKWESLGAYWICRESSLTQWFYKDKCFFSWFSGVDAIEHLQSAKKADVELEKLIKVTE